MAQVEVDPTQDTEFHDALRAHGIIPPKPPSRSPSPEVPSAADSRAAKLNSLPLDRINRALDEGYDHAGSSSSRGNGIVADGSGRRKAAVRNAESEDEEDVDNSLGKLDEEEERILLALRDERMRDMRKKARQSRFGRVYPISRPDYTREVTEASKEEPPDEQGGDDGESKSGKGNGTGVVCFLYKDGMDTCELMAKYLDTLAAKYPMTKFVSIIGDKCIPNYPDRNLPTLIIYRGGELHRQIVGLRREIGLDGMNTKCADIELLLTAVGAIRKEEAVDQAGSGEVGEALDDSERRNGGIRQGSGTGTGTGTRKTQEDEDAELDWDL